jgi:hypothetical protein
MVAVQWAAVVGGAADTRGGVAVAAAVPQLLLLTRRLFERRVTVVLVGLKVWGLGFRVGGSRLKL